MRRIKAWRLTGLFAAAVMTAAALCGCSGQEKKAVQEEKQSGDEQIYVGEYHSLTAEEGNYISDAVLGREGNVYYLEGNELGVKLFNLNVENMESRQIPIDLPENTIPEGLGIDGEGNLLIGLRAYKDLTVAEPVLESVILKKLTPDGEELLSADTGEIFLGNPDFYFANLLCDPEGNFYVCNGTDIFVLDSQGALRGQISTGYFMNNLFLMKNGRVGTAYYGDRDFEVMEISGDYRELVPLKTQVPLAYGTYQGSPDSDLLYTVEGALYSLNLSDEQPTQLLKWTDMDVNSAFLDSFELLEDGRVAALTNDFTTGESGREVVVLTKKNRSEVPEKEILTYGAYYLSFYAERDITAFNRQSDKYRIEVKEYGDTADDISARIDLFAADLTNGNIPDMIDLTYCPLTLEKLISLGVLEDLNPYLDEDGIIKREDYVESVLKAYEREGKLYAMMPYYGVDAIIGKISDVGEEKSWTLEDMMTLSDAKGTGMQLLPGADRSQILYLMCTMNQGLFVDKENTKCDFTGEEFKRILEFVKRFPAQAEYDPSLEKLRSGEILLYNDTVTAASQYQLYEFIFGGPVNLIGYPTFGESGLTLSSNGTTVGMSASSENKEGVWEFIRFNVSKDRQENVGSPNGGFPILRSALLKQLENDRKPVYGKDENGAEKEVAKSTWSMNLGSDNFSVEVYASSQEQTDRVLEMIESAQSGERMDQEILSIILEETSGYFEDQKSLESVIDVIQNRVQLYLNETS
jgi:ABC-type glycerol-3-phosphate transport system substrate-binding protein